MFEDMESSVRSKRHRPRLQCEGERAPLTRECCSTATREAPCTKTHSTTKTSASTSTRKPRSMQRRSRFSSSSLVMFSVVFVLFMALLLPSSSAKSGDWQECLVSPEDAWVPASHDSLTAIIQHEYDRRYTCITPQGAKLAARYVFDSKCTERTFTRETVNSCLKGRRIIFLGDSLSTQQGDSLLGMLGWHPDWLEKGHPKSTKFMTDVDGRQVPALTECYRQSRDPSRRCERCYDVFESSAPKTYKQSDAAHTGKAFSHWVNGRVVDPDHHTRKLQRLEGGDSSRVMGYQGDASTTVHGDGTQSYAHGDGTQRDVRRLGEAEPEEGQGDVQQDSSQETSVHVRMFPTPGSAAWARRTLADFNETRPSDIYVINFGAHYRENPEGESLFRAEMRLLLDDMADIAENATVVWREIAPVHFPSANASYDTMLGSNRQGEVCCTGTPPPVDPRNEWVEKYLSDNGLTDKIKVLRIYQMSRFRASAHRTCHLGAPQTPSYPDVGSPIVCPVTGLTLDCRHWSEPGVVEEWNRLMLNHLCPVE